jgi:hypothetical protein
MRDHPPTPPPGTKCPAVAEVDDVARATERPIAAHSSAAAAIQPVSRFDSTRHTLADGPGDALGTGLAGRGSRGVAGSFSFTMTLL